MKYLIALMLCVFTVFVQAQEELGIAILYQQVSSGGDWHNNQTNVAFIGTEHIIISYQLKSHEYYWRDSIVATDRVTRMVDLDEDGQEEQLHIDTYFTDDGGIYKLILNEGSPFMLSASNPTGGRVQFAGCIKHNLVYRSAVEAEFNTSSTPPVSKKLR